MTLGIEHYLGLAGLLFAIGFWGILTRKSIIFMYMSLELMLNAVNLGFVAFARYKDTMDGPVFVFFTLTVAAAEVAVGLALIVALYRKKSTAMTLTP